MRPFGGAEGESSARHHSRVEDDGEDEHDEYADPLSVDAADDEEEEQEDTNVNRYRFLWISGICADGPHSFAFKHRVKQPSRLTKLFTAREFFPASTQDNARAGSISPGSGRASPDRGNAFAEWTANDPRRRVVYDDLTAI